MTAAPSDFDPRQLWQGQPEAHAPITLAEIHERALAFRKQARRRRIVSWVAIALAVAGLWLSGRFDGWMMQLGAAWTLVAAIVVMWRWQRINSLEPLPGEGEALVEAYRNGLIRLRDARRTVLLWRIGPIVPGLVLVLLGRWFQLHTKGLSIQADHLVVLAMLAFVGVGFALAYARHQRGAQELQRMLDDLDRRAG